MEKKMHLVSTIPINFLLSKVNLPFGRMYIVFFNVYWCCMYCILHLIYYLQQRHFLFLFHLFIYFHIYDKIIL